MLKMTRCRVVVPVVLLTLYIAANVFGAQSESRWLVSPKLLEHARLKIVWENKLPTKKAESLQRLIILGERIYALSTRNYMVSFDRQKGKTIFGRTVAPVGVPITEMELYKDVILSASGNKLAVINPETGTEISSRQMQFRISCPPARNSSYLYLGGDDGRLHIFKADDMVQVFEVAADNDSIVKAIIAEESFVVFATEAGNVISIRPNKPQKLWQLDAGGELAGPFVRDGRSLFFASKDTNVYRVDIVGLSSRKLVWKHQVRGIPRTPPLVTKEVVYQFVKNKGLTAIDKSTGNFMWLLPEGLDLLAEVKGKAYVTTTNKTLVVMDNQKAKKLYSVNFAKVSHYAANPVDSKMYIADERGRIACIEPVP